MDIALLNKIKKERKKVKSSQHLAAVNMFLDKIFSNLEVKLEVKHMYPNSIFYKFNNEVVAEYDKKYNAFFYHYVKIYEVLSSEFGLNELKIDKLIICKVEKYLKFKGVTTYASQRILSLI